jgi:glycosyltransferase involved in cell wall biosynthesis
MVKVQLSAESIAALTLFELWSGGHTPNYIRWLVEAWQSQRTGTLRAIVTNRFLKQHESVFRDLANAPDSVIRWTAIDDADEAALDAARARAQAVDSASGEAIVASDIDTLLTLYWTLLQKYGRKFPTRHILLMNLDEYLLPLSAGRVAPADLSGIFFRPNYVYRSKEAKKPAGFRIFDTVQEHLVRRSLNHPQLRLVFSYVPEVAEGLQGRGTAKVILLNNPVPLPARHASPAERARIRSRLGVPADRELFLFFGEIRGPKGLWRLFDSLRLLRAEQEARICLAIVGQAEPVVEHRLASELRVFGASTQLMILRRAAYVDDTELFEWFTAADVVIAPYVRHAGTSGILLLAAAYCKPLISQDYGAMAKLVRENSLGLTVDTNDPTELARAIGRCLGETPPHEWNAETAYDFALNHSHEKFGEAVLGALHPFLV